ncbi:MAG: hypothetical protein HY423_00525 [Candidatus Lambdaproteobacteria bacterium]|nr:hypothetical protein [Candidatus Lambdaproteobacteria bacterium]
MAKKIELTSEQESLWHELCASVEIDPHWLLNALNQYYDLAERYGIMELDDELLRTKHNFGWIEYAVFWKFE